MLFIIYNTSHVRWKNLAYIGPQTKKLLTLINLHPNGLFSSVYFGPYGVLRPEIFLTHDRDWPRLTSTHLKGDGVPPEKNLKFGLKFSVPESITSGIVFSLNFFMRPAITARGISSSWIDFALELAAPGGLTSGSANARLVTIFFCKIVSWFS